MDMSVPETEEESEEVQIRPTGIASSRSEAAKSLQTEVVFLKAESLVEAEGENSVPTSSLRERS